MGVALTREFGGFLARVGSLRSLEPGGFRIGLGGFGRGRVLARALVALRLGLIRTAHRIDSLGHVRGIFGRIRVRLGGSVDVGRRLTLRDRGILKFNLGGPRRGR